MSQEEFVKWICERTVQIDAAEAAEMFRQLREADVEFKLRLIAELSQSTPK